MASMCRLREGTIRHTSIARTFSFVWRTQRPESAAMLKTRKRCDFYSAPQKSLRFSAICLAIFWRFFGRCLQRNLRFCTLRFENAAIFLRLRIFWDAKLENCLRLKVHNVFSNSTCITRIFVWANYFLCVILLGKKAHETSASWNYTFLGYTPDFLGT